MSDQPTDHRAEAEGRLDQVDEIRRHITPRDGLSDMSRIEGQLDAITCALIGIGHALLAGLLEPIEREWIPPDGTCPRCGRSDHPESDHDEAAARIAGRETR